MDVEIIERTSRGYKDTKVPLHEVFKDRLPEGKTQPWCFGINYGFSLIDNPNLVSKWIKNAPCHQNMNVIPNIVGVGNSTNIDRFFSELRFGGFQDEAFDRKIAESYWLDCFNQEESPWKSILKDHEVHKNPKGDIIAFSIKVNNDTSNQVMTNLAIATRKMQENSEAYETYKKLLEYKELKPGERVLLTNLVTPYHSGSFRTMNFTPGHHCLNVSTVDVTKFLKGTPVFDKNLTVRKGARYTPCNTIWEERGSSRYADSYQPNNVIKKWPSFTKAEDIEDLSKMLFKVKYVYYKNIVKDNNAYQISTVNLDNVVKDLISFR